MTDFIFLNLNLSLPSLTEHLAASAVSEFEHSEYIEENVFIIFQVSRNK